MIASALMAAALAGPVLGAPVAPGEPGPSTLRVLNPRTLEVMPGSPTLPVPGSASAPGAPQLVLAPDRQGIAVRDAAGVTLFDVDRPAPVHEIALDPAPATFSDPAPLLAWPSARRLLVFECGAATATACTQTAVRVIDPRSGTLVRTVRLDGLTRQVSRAGDRFLLAQADDSGAPVSRTLVVDAEGRQRHRLGVHGQLNGPLVADTRAERVRVARVDPGSGRVVARRTLKRFRGGGWASPVRRITDLRSAGGNQLLGLDRRTLETRRAPFTQRKPLQAVPGGYVTLARDGSRVTGVRGDGRVRWTARADGNVGGLVGPNVYVTELVGNTDCSSDAPERARTRVIDAGTGKRRGFVAGAFTLAAPAPTTSADTRTVEGVGAFCDRG